MGNWNMNIQGTGCHHNGKPEIDANEAMQAFVDLLFKQGHTIDHAVFTCGGAETYVHTATPTNFTNKIDVG